MENCQFWTLVALIAVGFTYMRFRLVSIDTRLKNLDVRLEVIEKRMGMIWDHEIAALYRRRI